jgi:hypothetical protein
MSKYKTCEERILCELEETEDQLTKTLTELKDLYNRYDSTLEKLINIKSLIKEIAVYNISDNSRPYISFSSLWEGWDDDKIEFLLDLVPQIKRKEDSSKKKEV